LGKHGGGDLGQRLLRMKNELEDKKSELLQLQGELKSLMEQLEQEYGIDSLEQAEERIQKEEMELEQAKERILEKIGRVEKIIEDSR